VTKFLSSPGIKQLTYTLSILSPLWLRYPALPGLVYNPLNIFCFVNSFQKCVEFQALGGEGTGIKTAPKLSLVRWDVCAKFYQDPCRGLGFHYLSTYQQTNICVPIFIYVSREDRLKQELCDEPFIENRLLDQNKVKKSYMG